MEILGTLFCIWVVLGILTFFAVRKPGNVHASIWFWEMVFTWPKMWVRW